MELRNRAALEDKFLRNANRLSTKHRKELLGYLGHPPDTSNVPASFWAKVEKEERELLLLILILVSTENQIQHGASRQAAQSNARAFANVRGNLIAQQYARNSQAKLLSGLRKIASEQRPDSPTPGALTGNPLDGLRDARRKPVVDLAKTIFGQERNEEIVSTEVTGASVHGSETAMRERGLASGEDWWMVRPWRTKSGPCKICRELNRQPRSQWGIISRWAASGPPAHPYCACVVIYAAVGVDQSLGDEGTEQGSPAEISQALSL